MQISKNKTAAIAIAIILTLSMGGSMMLIPNASAHTPAWSIPTYAYINVAPNPIGVGQTLLVYMWLDPVYGAAGGTIATTGTNGYTASSALLANNYRFHNYQLTITAPDGTVSTQTWAIVTDSTSSQYYYFTPTQVGTYSFNFTFPGQAYGVNGNGYAQSPLINDTYLPSSASTTLTVQQQPIPPAITSEPLPTNYWSHPIYGENSNWWSISSNWLGTGSPVEPATGSSTITGLSNGGPIQRYPGDAVGPLTAHVMWTTPIETGGVVGGNNYLVSGVGYFEGSSYLQRFTNPIIMNGMLFYTEPVSFTGASSGPTVAVNLETGQQIWSSTNVPALSFGYIYSLYDPDQHGVFKPIIVASIGGGLTGIPATWELFDAYTGDALFNVTNVPSGTTVMGPQGEQLRYVFANAGTAANPQWYLAQWNSSKLWMYDINPYTGGGSLSPSIINATNGALITTLPLPITGTTGTLPSGGSIFVPYGSTLTANANIGIAQGQATSSANPTTTYDWNVSLPWLNTMPLQPTYSSTTGLISPATPGTNPVTVVAAFTGNMMLCRNGSLPVGFPASDAGYPQLPYTYFAVNLNASRGAIGSILWMQNYNPPAGNITLIQGPIDPTTNVFVLAYAETMQIVGYSLTTGAQLWGPTASRATFDYYGNPGTPDADYQAAYGNIYASAFAGICYCWNDLTGQLLWTYGNGSPGSDNSTNAGFTTNYGDYPTFLQAVGNGVIYLTNTEHTITDPIYKGAQTIAVNATTGQQIWTLSDYTGEFTAISYAIADGYSTFYNGYDDQIYSIGQGSSATIVQAPQTAITAGNNVVIKGTVIDTSAGTQQTTVKADFPNGVPVASDASMTAWMEYVYQQQAEPTNFTGVTVTLTAIDPNGNYITLGTATTDSNGLYYYTWTTPNIPGNYLVTATFAGTNGYWPSNAQTPINVQAAPSAAATPTPAPASNTNTYILGSAIAIIVVIIIVGAVSILLARKRP
jgi:outer membrane protein assembly factor BamB